jgi:hypothetical protein
VVVTALLCALLGFVLWGAGQDYSRRVTSDTPTFVALLSQMGDRPFAKQSPFVANEDVATPHATPYMQALAFIWRAVDGDIRNPSGAARFLTLIGLGVFGFTLFAVFLYTRRLAGDTAAWLAIPVLLTLFGPPHVIWASDLTLHGALYAPFFPQNLALAFALLALLALGARSRLTLAAACVLVAATMLVHPFTGVLLALLATADSIRLAIRDGRAYGRGPVALAVGYGLGMLWPVYSLDHALAETRLPGFVFVPMCAAAPFVARLIARRWRGETVLRPLGAFAGLLVRRRTVLGLAIAGAVGTAAVAAWEWLLVANPPDNSSRMAIYWVDERWRWPLLLVAGTAGLAGLAALARRGRVLPAVWFAGCFALGAAGAAGLDIPVWYRFVLFCQVPLAIGVAVVLADRRRKAALVVACGFAIALVVKVVTLVALPTTITYLGSPLQAAWSLGDHVPNEPGIVATDPDTAYFIPAATGHRVLTVGKGHVGSKRELDAAAAGYDLLHRYYAGGTDWWDAGKEMWRRGVRYVVIQKQTTLEPRELSGFMWQTARLETPEQRRALGNYFYENNRVGTLLYDSREYAVYRLDHDRLFGPDGG